MKNRLLGGYDLILMFYPQPEDRQKGRVAHQIEFLFKKAGLLK